MKLAILVDFNIFRKPGVCNNDTSGCTSSEAHYLFGRDAKTNAARTLRIHDAAGLYSVGLRPYHTGD